MLAGECDRFDGIGGLGDDLELPPSVAASTARTA